jgi:hypothetical protein
MLTGVTPNDATDEFLIADSHSTNLTHIFGVYPIFRCTSRAMCVLIQCSSQTETWMTLMHEERFIIIQRVSDFAVKRAGTLV